MSNILLAPDSFKGSLSALEACAALERGARRAMPEAEHEFVAVPLADGGEGTLEALILGAGGRLHALQVRGPLGDPVSAHWAALDSGHALIEMAQASGLNLVPTNSVRAAVRSSSYGTGQLIGAALDAGYRKLLIGIGGSATTDAGAGALQALGLRLLDENGLELPPGGAALRRLATIDTSNLDARLRQAQITVLCDVSNPLYGPTGAAQVYAPQKGAIPAEVRELDAALHHFAKIACAEVGVNLHEMPGSGAAGGMGFGLITFTRAKLTPGIEVVLETTRFAEKLETANLVLTGEGALDRQTLHGKAIAGVARAAAQARGGRGVPVIAFGGAVLLTGAQLRELGLVGAMALPDRPMTLRECMSNAGTLLENAAERALLLYAGAVQNAPTV